MTWRFSLYRELRLKLSFSTFYFSSGVHDCWSGNVTFTQNNNQPFLFYCGYQSHFRVFPQMSDFQIKLAACIHIDYLTNATFSVIEANIYATVQSQGKLGTNPTKVYHTHKRSHLALVWHITVRKTNFVIISVGSDWESVTVVDGPGSFCDQGQPNSNRFSCSSFQCVLNAVLTLTSDFDTEYTSKSILILKHTFLNKTSSCNLQCPHTVCAFSFNTLHGMELNASITSMSIESEDQYTISCIYGGLFSPYIWNENYMESNILCENLEANNLFSRNLYSLDSVLYIFLYQYQKYFRMYMSLHLTLLKCKVALLNLNMIQELCHHDHPSGYYVPLHCRRCFEEVYSLFGVSFVYVPLKSGLKIYPILLVTHKEHSCFVVQSTDYNQQGYENITTCPMCKPSDITFQLGFTSEENSTI